MILKSEREALEGPPEVRARKMFYSSARLLITIILGAFFLLFFIIITLKLQADLAASIPPADEQFFPAGIP